MLHRQATSLVIGGDCTIALGVIAGFLRHGVDVGLLYFDGHLDLNTPATSRSGILDSMGIAHLLGEVGGAEALSHIGPRFPQINAGLLFQEAMACLEVFVSSPQFAGLVIAEINPDHADEEGRLATTFVENLVNVFAARQS